MQHFSLPRPPPSSLYTRQQRYVTHNAASMNTLIAHGFFFFHLSSRCGTKWFVIAGLPQLLAPPPLKAPPLSTHTDTHDNGSSQGNPHPPTPTPPSVRTLKTALTLYKGALVTSLKKRF